MLSARLRRAMTAKSHRVLPLLAALSLAAIALNGCGGSSKEPAASGTPAAAAKVNLADFPQTDGKLTLNQLQKKVNAQQNANLLPAANSFVRNRPNRLPFGLFDQDRKAIWGPTAIYIATGPDTPAVGPFAAPAHTFTIPAKYRSTTTQAQERGGRSAEQGQQLVGQRPPWLPARSASR